MSILTSRLTRQGFTEATVTRQGSDRIRVEIPNVSDPNQILTIIGTPAQLYFVDEDGNNLMEGSMVKNAQAAQDQDGKPCIAFELTDEGAKIFAEATAANLGKTISITLDGETISRATVNTVIAGGKGEITGNFTADEAKNLATLILSGALPLNLTQLEVSAISATLGVEALDRASGRRDRRHSGYAVHAVPLSSLRFGGRYRADDLYYDRRVAAGAHRRAADPAGRCGHHPGHRHGRRCECRHL